MHKETMYPRHQPISQENRESANDLLNSTVEESLIIGRRLQARETTAILQSMSRWFGTKVVALLNAWRQSRKMAKSKESLWHLDDHILRDIGIYHRSQILSVIHERNKDNASSNVSQEKSPVISLAVRTPQGVTPQIDRAA